MTEYKFWQRRESRHMKDSKNQNKNNLILEAIAQLSGGAAAGPKQMKIVVKKEDLEQLLETIRDGRSSLIRRGPPSSTAAAATSLEQRLNLLRRRQILRAAGQAKGRNRSGSWRPVLQSIPEEICNATIELIN